MLLSQTLIIFKRRPGILYSEIHLTGKESFLLENSNPSSLE
jgi:hypothetical protein